VDLPVGERQQQLCLRCVQLVLDSKDVTQTTLRATANTRLQGCVPRENCVRVYKHINDEKKPRSELADIL
jgi:hypothetical protein